MRYNLSEIHIHPIKPTDKGLVSFASFVLDDSIYLGNIALYTDLSSQAGYRLTYPTKILSNGKQIPCFHPINKKTADFFTDKVIARYLEVRNGLL